MVDIQKVVEENDRILKEREQRLIQEINRIYDKAVSAATREFKYLESLNPNIKPSSAQVRKILSKTLSAFETEFKVLVEPIAEATRDSYEEGLRETGQIVGAAKGEKNAESND